MVGRRPGLRLSLLLALACTDPLWSPGFDPALWQFRQVVPLRGSKIGGWQEACAHLKFVDDRRLLGTPKVWTCGILVGMPLATTTKGPISPEFASQTTATIATRASGRTFHSQPAWLGEDYCILLRRTMKELFDAGLGVTVNQC